MNKYILPIASFLIFFYPQYTQAQYEISLSVTQPSQPVFMAGEEKYTCFRIPAIIKLKNGDLLAFAEGRKNGCSDTGDIDVVMKRSTDGGRSWSSLQVIWNDGDNTCGNPAPVIDSSSGHISLLTTWNLGSDRESQIIDQKSTGTRRVYLIRSKDRGNSWSKPKDITAKVKLNNWTWYATGPGSGIQIKNGSFRGRIIIGCDHIEAITKKYYSHAIYSDNHGRTWKLGGSSPRDQVNECEVVELPGNRLMMNMRNYDRNQKTRQVMFSDDGGLSWSGQKHQQDLIEPICQASLLSHNNLLFFSNPASQDKREKLCIKISYNHGITWPDSILLYAGPSAYSDLVLLSDKNIGCLYERGEESPYEQITFESVEIFGQSDRREK